MLWYSFEVPHLADDSHKMSKLISSAAVAIGPLRFKLKAVVPSST